MSSAITLFYSSTITLFLVGTFLLTICQILVEIHGKHKIKDKTTKVLIYGLYISAFICNILGYTLHHSKHTPLFCEAYGFTFCVIAYGGSKSFMLGFFVRRAKKANVDITSNNKCKQLFFDRIGPIYPAVYFIVFTCLVLLIFKGQPVPIDEANDIGSWCFFNSWQVWFIILFDVIDVFNCVATLLLFLFPLLTSIKRLKTNDNKNNHLLLKFLTAMKWNVALSFVATITCLITATIVPFIGEYMWFVCIGDPFVNALCAFFMLAPNRKFAYEHCICVDSVGAEEEMASNMKQIVVDIAPDPPV